MAYNIWVLFKREFSSYFNSAIAYVFVVFFLVVTNAFFMAQFFVAKQAEMRGYFGLLPFFFLFFIPAITMRLWSEERKVGTVESLMTLPVSTIEAVLAKYLAGYVFFLINMALTLTLPITVAIVGDPDWGPIIGGYLAALLLGAAFMAIGAFASSLTENQIIAFIMAMSFCFVLYVLNLPQVVAQVSSISRTLGGALDTIGVQSHFDNLTRGVLDLRDLVYFFSLSALFITLNTFGVESRKY